MRFSWLATETDAQPAAFIYELTARLAAEAPGPETLKDRQRATLRRILGE